MIPGVRRFGIAIVALGVLALLLARWMGGGDSAPEYVAERIGRGPISAAVTATGTVNPVTTVQVGTYVSGPLQLVAADFNTPVKRGQLLARIDPRPFQVKVDDARAAVANARARLDKDIYSLTPEELKDVPSMPGSLDEALNNLKNDHEFLLKGDVFTEDVIEAWIENKIERELNPVRLRPTPTEFALYFDI